MELRIGNLIGSLEGFVVVLFCNWASANLASADKQMLLLALCKTKLLTPSNKLLTLWKRFLFEVLSTTEFREICTTTRNKTFQKFNSPLAMLIQHFKIFITEHVLITYQRKNIIIFCYFLLLEILSRDIKNPILNVFVKFAYHVQIIFPFFVIQGNSAICFICETKAFTNLLYKPIL